MISLNDRNLPSGLRMGLLQNRRALDHFEAMTDYEQNSVIQWSRTLRTRAEMDQLVSNIAGGNVQHFHSAGTNRQNTQ